MIKTPNAGSAARGGILGKRKRVLPEPPCFVTLWRRDAAGHFEQVRCLLSEARGALSEAQKCAPAAALAECGNDPIKSRRNAGVSGARKSNEPPRRRCRCRYCGAASAYPWGALQICAHCEKIRDRHEPQATIATAPCGWVGDDKLYLQVQRTLANRERTAAAERFAKHGPGRLEREGPAVRVSEAVDRARRAARANFRQRASGSAEFEEAAE
jgi:hypothetical protein